MKFATLALFAVVAAKVSTDATVVLTTKCVAPTAAEAKVFKTATGTKITKSLAEGVINTAIKAATALAKNDLKDLTDCYTKHSIAKADEDKSHDMTTGLCASEYNSWADATNVEFTA